MEAKGLNEKGLTGIIAFWMIIMNFVMPLCTVAFSIYWIILLGDKVWLQSVGYSLFISNIFLLILSLASFVFDIISMLKIKILFEQFSYQLFIVTVIISLVLCSVSLSLSSYSSADRAYQDMFDYCQNHPGKKIVEQFYIKHSTFISQKNYILKRTVEANSALAGIFGTWMGSFATYIVSFILLKDKEDGQPLLKNNRELDQLSIDHNNEINDHNENSNSNINDNSNNSNYSDDDMNNNNNTNNDSNTNKNNDLNSSINNNNNNSNNNTSNYDSN